MSDSLLLHTIADDVHATRDEVQALRTELTEFRVQVEHRSQRSRGGRRSTAP